MSWRNRSVGHDIVKTTEMWANCASVLTSEVCALWEHEQLQRLSDVTEVVQHALQVFLVTLPTTLNEDKAGHLHRPAWKTHSKSSHV